MIVIVDYGMGNLASISNMIKKAGGQAVISSAPHEIEQATKLILPGVGAFDEGIKNLKAAGLLPVLHKKALDQKVPVLGICLGLQLFTRKSEEGSFAGLGWLNGETVRFKKSETLKTPHMGWNTLVFQKTHPLFSGEEPEPRFYFVHSYHVVCEPAEALAKTHHGYDFVSAAGKENIAGVQFHPEKSHRFGMRLFKNFLSWT